MHTPPRINPISTPRHRPSRFSPVVLQAPAALQPLPRAIQPSEQNDSIVLPVPVLAPVQEDLAADEAAEVEASIGEAEEDSDSSDAASYDGFVRQAPARATTGRAINPTNDLPSRPHHAPLQNIE